MKIEMREAITLDREEYKAYCATMGILSKIHCNTKDSVLSELTMNLWQSLENLDERYFSAETRGER